MGQGADLIVAIEDGHLQGTTGTDLDGGKFLEFLGIPYAQPPLNELRFKPPQPVKPWTGVRDATKPGNSSLSKEILGTQLTGAEDCLFLNVYTKKLANKKAKLRPVMVFIHGGGLISGTSSPELAGPQFLMIKDVVLVTINYRLGALGFLSISGTDVTGNMGLKDQVLALEWVQRNIKHFNGDPSNVTIFGESAGGASVHAHVLSPSSKGLFHKAILQSGSVLSPWFWGCKNNAKDLIARLDKSIVTQQQALEILKQVSGMDILQAQEGIFDVLYPAYERPFSAVVEDESENAFLMKDPREIMKEGSYNQVPIMMGFTDNEGMLIETINQNPLAPPFEMDLCIPVELLAPKGTEENKRIKKILEDLYSNSKNIQYDAFTDSAFLAGIVESLSYHISTATQPIYFYRMSISSQLNVLKAFLQKLDQPGACHADDVGYLFRSPLSPDIKPGSLEDRGLRSFVELWTNFAEFGNPTPNNAANTLNVSWPPVTSKDDLTVLDIGQQLEVKDLPERNRMRVWLDIYRKWDELRYPIATTEDGKLRGTTGLNLDGGRFLKFFGIPYAQPPIDELRFKPPLPAKPWEGVRDARKVGSSSLTVDEFTMKFVGSEDCLNLNVYTRELPSADSKLKPVMVYIHGGGLTFGCNRPGLYGPEFLLLKDIVLVTINYRLGVLGFLCVEGTEATGNMGLKDQNLALKWVQKNIKNFNGDPNNVTIFGESAGAASVHTHVLSPASKGLFHKAILQSGCALNPWFWGSKNNARALAKQFGKTPKTEQEALELLKQVPGLDFLNINEGLNSGFHQERMRNFAAVVEEQNETAFLDKSPRELIRAGEYNQVPLMVGYTDTEGLLRDFLVAIGFPLSAFHSDVILSYDLGIPKGSEDSKKIVAIFEDLYSKNSKENPYDELTDSLFLSGITEILEGHLATARNPIYLYRMTINTQLNQFKRLLHILDKPGVSHADDLGYLWHTDISPEIKPGSIEDKYLRIFVELWTNFAQFGNPTPAGGSLGISWPSLKNKDKLNLLEIGNELTIKDDLPERHRVEVWKNIYSQYLKK